MTNWVKPMICFKAQKPWAKLLSKVNKCKIDYHNACKNERTAVNQERNASGDTSLSPDQVLNPFCHMFYQNLILGSISGEETSGQSNQSQRRSPED